ncbi:MAG: hypothetical protein ACOCUS_04810, partial [Polyangiales bacterium]
MKASYRWLRELAGVDAPPDEMAERLTRAGLEVEGVERCGAGLERVVVGEVRGRRAHLKRDKLTLVTVHDGEQEQEVVCGAPNVPETGGRILFARLGAELPNGMTIEERKIGGELSRGMICSEVELDIGPDAEGIFVLGDDGGQGSAAPGTPVAEVLGLEDAIFEIGLTPNRPDGLGHLGLARDVALLFGQGPLEPPTIEPPDAIADVGAELVPGGPQRFALTELWQGGAEIRRRSV